MLVNIFKTAAYKLSQLPAEERAAALSHFARLDSVKIKQVTAAMCEIYVNLAQGRISREEGGEVMKLIEKDLRSEIGA